MTQSDLAYCLLFISKNITADDKADNISSADMDKTLGLIWIQTVWHSDDNLQ